MQITTINGQPTLLIDRTLTTADAAPPAEVTDGMATITTTPPTPDMRHDAIPLAAIASWRTLLGICLLYTSPSPRDRSLSRMPSSA